MDTTPVETGGARGRDTTGSLTGWRGSMGLEVIGNDLGVVGRGLRVVGAGRGVVGAGRGVVGAGLGVVGAGLGVVVVVENGWTLCLALERCLAGSWKDFSLFSLGCLFRMRVCGVGRLLGGSGRSLRGGEVGSKSCCCKMLANNFSSRDDDSRRRGFSSGMSWMGLGVGLVLTLDRGAVGVGISSSLVEGSSVTRSGLVRKRSDA